MNLFKNTREDSNKLSYDYSYDEQSIIIDVAEDDEYYFVYAEVPGKTAEDIQLKFRGERLSIRILEETEEQNPIAEKTCLIQERTHEERERLISFEEEVDKKNVDAKLENGLLIVFIKKICPDEEDVKDLITIRC